MRIASTVAQHGMMNLNAEGIIGFARHNAADSLGRLYMDSLYDNGAIDHKMFSFLVALGNRGESKLTVGGYDLDKYAKGPMHWHKLNDENNW